MMTRWRKLDTGGLVFCLSTANDFVQWFTRRSPKSFLEIKTRRSRLMKRPANPFDCDYISIIFARRRSSTDELKPSPAVEENQRLNMRPWMLSACVDYFYIKVFPWSKQEYCRTCCVTVKGGSNKLRDTTEQKRTNLHSEYYFNRLCIKIEISVL